MRIIDISNTLTEFYCKVILVLQTIHLTPPPHRYVQKGALPLVMTVLFEHVDIYQCLRYHLYLELVLDILCLFVDQVDFFFFWYVTHLSKYHYF